jgi:predicted secreted hydrolase
MRIWLAFGLIFQRILTLPSHSLRSLVFVATYCLACCLATFSVNAAKPEFSPMIQSVLLSFPRDFGAHPAFRNEWWCVAGWLETPDKKPLGFQVTFFRVATEHDRANPSRFAPNQLIVAHAALSDPAVGKLLHDQKSSREEFGLSYTREGDTDVKLGDWTMVREKNGRYQTSVKGQDFSLNFSLTPTQPPMLQDQQGFSRKGPRPEQASSHICLVTHTVAGTTHSCFVVRMASEWAAIFPWIVARIQPRSNVLSTDQLVVLELTLTQTCPHLPPVYNEIIEQRSVSR